MYSNYKIKFVPIFTRCFAHYNSKSSSLCFFLQLLCFLWDLAVFNGDSDSLSLLLRFLDLWSLFWRPSAVTVCRLSFFPWDLIEDAGVTAPNGTNLAFKPLGISTFTLLEAGIFGEGRTTSRRRQHSPTSGFDTATRLFVSLLGTTTVISFNSLGFDAIQVYATSLECVKWLFDQSLMSISFPSRLLMSNCAGTRTSHISWSSRSSSSSNTEASPISTAL